MTQALRGCLLAALLASLWTETFGKDRNACSPTHDAPPGWRRASGRAFTLLLPPEFHADEVKGKDSEVGQWSDGDQKITYDFGWYSDPLTHTKGIPGRAECELEVAGYLARIVTYHTPDGPYVTAIHWPRVPSGNAEDKASQPLRLTIQCSGSGQVTRELCLMVFHTVRFKGTGH